MISLTCMVLSVMVPVLSTQSTSTRASVSIHFISCTRTFFPARRITLITRATLASRYNPSGIIPITAATMEVTLFLSVSSERKNCWLNKRIPMGMMMIPTAFTSLSRERIISDCSPSFMAFASNVSLDM